MNKRGRRFLEWVTPVGNLLVAQLVFVCCALTVVLIVPAAVALQRTVQAILDEHENAVFRTFVAELPGAIRRYLLIGLAIDVAAAMIMISILFWYAADGPAAVVALVVLIVVSGLLIGGYLCGLAVTVAGDQGVRRWLSASYRRLTRQPLHVAGTVVIMLTWLLLLSRVPTLALIGTGLVPALLAHWLRRRDPELVEGP
ncbi:hypothetical protein [Microlunatus soli]|uniref:Uncharacterized membrane protein YesL n=1 Tax=Microlunatus soli TaxID=630515 RepID=A0A1H1Y6E2_9ACTN|nr:hypothetical protein [Microlunatus soli]SDT16955.1 Uncharacterized membrane protein YesL [Microlunatus soli]